MDNIKKQNSKKKNKKDNALKIIKKIAIVISFVLNAFFIFSLLLGSCSNNSKSANAETEDFYLSSDQCIYTAYRIDNFETSDMNDIPHSVNLFNNVVNNPHSQILSYGIYECYYNGSHIENINLLNVSKLESVRSGSMYMIKAYYFDGSYYVSDFLTQFQLCLSFLDNIPYVSNPDSVYGLRAWRINWSQYAYYIPPFISLPVETPSFEYNCAFKVGNTYYTGVSYSYHGDYIFKGDTPYVFNRFQSGDLSSYVFRYSNFSSNLNVSIPYISFINLSSSFLEHLSKFYVDTTASFISGRYYLSSQLFNNYTLYQSPQSGLNRSFVFDFVYNNTPFTSITYGYVNSYPTSGDYTFVSSAGIEYYSYGSILYGDDLATWNLKRDGIWEKTPFSTLKVDYIDLSNNPLTNDLYNFIINFCLPYKVDNGYIPISGGGSINPLDGTFTLFTSIFTNISNMLNIEIYKNITLMSLCLIPLVSLLILTLIRLFRH